MKKTIIAAAALVAMVGCNKTLIEAPMTDSNYGYINLGITADTEMVVTKATGDVTEDDNYLVAIFDASSKPIWNESDGANEGYILYNEENIANEDLWTRPAGSYKIDVKNMTDAAALEERGKKQIGLSSYQEFTVKSGVENTVNVSCAPINSYVTANHDLSNQVFVDPVISLVKSGQEYELVWGHYEPTSEKEYGVYYSGGTEVTYKLDVTMFGTTTKKRYTETITTQSGKWTQINFTSNNSDGTIIVSITYNDSYGDPVEITQEIKPLEGEIITNE